MDYVTFTRRGTSARFGGAEHARASANVRRRAARAAAGPAARRSGRAGGGSAGRLQRRRQRQHRQWPDLRPGDRRFPDFLCEATRCRPRRPARWRRTTCASAGFEPVGGSVHACRASPTRSKPTSRRASPPARAGTSRMSTSRPTAPWCSSPCAGRWRQEAAGNKAPSWRIWQYVIATDTLTPVVNPATDPDPPTVNDVVTAIPARRAHGLHLHAPAPVAGRPAG